LAELRAKLWILLGKSVLQLRAFAANDVARTNCSSRTARVRCAGVLGRHELPDGHRCDVPS